MAKHEHFPFSVALDDTDEPADVIDALVLEPFAAGAQPSARVVRLERVNPDATLRATVSAPSSRPPYRCRR